MKKVVADCYFKEGKLIVRNRKIFDNDISNFKNGEGTLTVERRTRKRSSQQNKYYWSVIIPLFKQGLNDLGNEMNNDLTHEFIKSKFNPKEIIFKETGEAFQYGASTTEMSTTDFMVFIDEIQKFAAVYLNTVIPDPLEL